MKKCGIYLLVLVMLIGYGVSAVIAQDAATVMMGGNDALGSFLVSGDGMTLYRFMNDQPGVSACVDQCATNWPPLTVEEGVNPSLAAGVPGRLGVITRADGGRQVTYNGTPLYFWSGDTNPGETNGQGFREVWYVVNPPDVSLSGNADLGDFLVDAGGMTLYMFMNDTENTSTCVDQCAANWPPLTVASADDLATQPGIVGEFSTAARADGSLQVTFNSIPLYVWSGDTNPGDATGQGFREVWYVVKPPTVSLSSTEELGDFLVGPNGMTLYLFTSDEGSTSTCYEQCAVNWPPLLSGAGETLVAAEGISGELGTTERTDGTLQVTYNGVPLYYWIRDVIPGDTTGHGVRDVWYVVPPDTGM